ncbi:MAG: prolyl oligopeptidase family serine peptidase [Gammaproteobacteria bacterium]|nr:prolyl oligopeptidase family serine peptidase [Gammaproteobacteria bacterium]
MRYSSYFLVASALLMSACGGNSPSLDPVSASGEKVWPIFDEPPSGRANQGVVVNGEFVGTDEVHFARGANADGIYHEEYYCTNPTDCPPTPQPSPVEEDDVYRHSTWGAFGADRAAHNGDYLLPTDTATWPDFTADIAFVRMEADSEDLYVHIRFVSFPAPEAQIATFTFTNVNAAPALNDWPRNAGIGSAYSHAFTLWGDGGEVAEADGTATDLINLGGAVRVTDHALEARIPLTALPTGPWLVSVGSGLADPNDHTQYWTVPAGAPTATSPGTDANTAPGSNVWDLAFTPHDPNYHDDHIQGDLLLNGDVTTANIVINPATLQSNATTVAPVITGRINHTYQSAFDFGDGIARGTPSPPPANLGPAAGAQPNSVRPRDAAVNYEYTGAMQPYLAYIPTAYPNSNHDWPLVLYFHGLNNYSWEPFGLTLGIEDQLENRGYLFASLLGRGDLFFEGRGELDPLEVIQHMSARYRIDPNRIYILGHSHGGAGVMNVSRRNPDLFAGVVSTQIQEQPSETENYLHLPTIHVAGAADPIDNGAAATARYQAAVDLGYDSQAIIYTNKTHENSAIYDTIEQIFDLFDRHVNPGNPGQVIYSRAGGDFDESLGLLHDGAYWVSAMQAVNDAATMSINATSFGIAHEPLDPDNATTTQDNAFDSGGVNSPSRTIGTHSQSIPAYGPITTVSNQVDITTTNLTAATFDLARMQIDISANDAVFNLTLTDEFTLRLNNAGVSSISWQAEDSGAGIVAAGTASGSTLEITVPSSATVLRFQ